MELVQRPGYERLARLGQRRFAHPEREVDGIRPEEGVVAAVLPEVASARTVELAAVRGSLRGG
jgi:hypothetical protein